MLLFTLFISLFSLAFSQQQVFQSQSIPSIPSSDFIVTSLSRSIELGGATSKANTVYTLRPSNNNNGDDKLFMFALDGKDASKLSWIEAFIGKTGNTRKPVKMERVNDGNDAPTSSYYKIHLPSSTTKESPIITLSIYTSYNHLTTPKPATLPQEAANQGMYWEADLLAGSQLALESSEKVELPAESVKIRVKCPTPRAAEDIVPNGWTASHTPGSSAIVFTNTQPVTSSSSSQIASIHYEQPEPVLSIRELQRTIQVSHWGNHIAVDDDIKLVNDGPKLKGHFSRLTHQALSFQRRGASFVTPHTLNNFAFTLPPNIHSPYFIDEVGNVSTSRFRPSPRISTSSLSSAKTNMAKSHLQLTPRYPLLGGWNYTFSIGYKQPLQDVLRYDSKDSSYKLAVPFLTDLKNAAFDEVVFRVILPEGAHDVAVSWPFDVNTLPTTKHFSYLDTTGRPVVIATRKACSEYHAQDVIITYKFNTLNMVQKPFAVAAVASVAFAAFALVGRIDWSLKG